MEIFALINVILTLGAMTVYGIRNFGKKKKPAIAPAPTRVKAVKASPSGHKLVNTYVGRNDGWVAGWRFKCSCGATGTSDHTKAPTHTANGRLGTEASAIEKFKAHRDNYLSANGPDEQEHEDTAKLRKLEAEFAEWRNACYCKDTNDDLIVLKHLHLDSKPTTTVN